MRLFHHNDIKYLLLIYVAAAAMIFLYGRIDRSAQIFSTSPDIRFYRSMAQASPHLATDVPRPYAYRILAPYLAGLLPFADTVAFYFCSIVAFIGLVGILYAFLRYSGINAACAALTTILYILNRSLSGFAIWEYFRLDDLLSFIEIIALFWTMEKQRWLAFSLILAIGALTRETPMVIIPVAFVFIAERHTIKHDLKKLLLAVTPSIVIFFVLRALVFADGGFTFAESFLNSVPKVAFPATWYRIIINAWIPMSFLPFIFFDRTVAFFRGKKYAAVFLLLVTVSVFFGGDNERLIAPAFAIVCLLYGTILQEELKISFPASSILLGCAFLTTINHLFARYPVHRSATIIISLGATAIATLYLLWMKQRGRGKASLLAAEKRETY